jgi:hypothetical protein
LPQINISRARGREDVDENEKCGMNTEEQGKGNKKYID